MGREMESHIVDLFEVTNPFPGLRSFEENEHMLFFGREEQVDDLITKLRKNRFLAVIGTSGSGKSSLVKSGLLPSLYGGFMAQSGSNWQTVTFRPGVDPIGNMSKALCESNYNYLDELGVDNVDYSDIIESGLRRSDRGLIDFYHQNMSQRKGDNLLILVDQFEELFRFSDIEKSKQDGFSDAVAFIELLLTASRQSDVPVYIVFTMRSDFLGECTRFKGFPEAINDGHYLVPRMSREQIREVIEGPVKVGGAEISRTLVNRILNDLGDNPDQLPILQHALMRVWDYWRVQSQQTGPLDNEHYEAIGTLKGALSQHAEEAYSELEEDENQTSQNLCKAIFKTLTDRGKNNRGTRRPTPVKEVMRLTNATFEQVNVVTRVFRESGRGFLLPDMEVELSESSILDISHESLMRVWVSLMTWVEEESESIQMYLRLTEAAEQYEQRKGGLWRNPELSLAIKWKNDNEPNELWAQRLNEQFEHTMLFLDYSIDQQEKEERYKEEQQKSRLRRARIFAVTVGSVAMVAISLAFWANNEKKKADKAKEDADQKSTELAVVNNELNIKEKNLEKAVKEAEKSAKNARQSAVAAMKAKRVAERERENAKQSEANAMREKKIAEQAQSLAMTAKKTAEMEKSYAERLKAISDANAAALASVSKYAQGDFDQSMRLAKEAYNLNREKDGSPSRNSILNALYLNWNKALNHENELEEHLASVRALDVYVGRSEFFSVDDNLVLNVSRLTRGKFSLLSSTKLPKPVKALKMNKNGNAIAVLFQDGQLAKYAVKNEVIKFAGNLATLGKIQGNARIYQVQDELLVLAAGKLWIVENGKIKSQFTGVSTFAVGSDKNQACLWVRNNRIQTFHTIKELGSDAALNLQFGGIATTASIAPSGQQFVVGTLDGKVVIGDMWDESNNSLETPNSFAKQHLSAVSMIKWVEKLNGEPTLITSSYDHTVKLVTVSDFLAKKYASESIRLDLHKSWIFGFLWIEKEQGIITFSEDSKVKFSLLSSELLNNRLNEK